LAISRASAVARALSLPATVALAAIDGAATRGTKRNARRRAAGGAGRVEELAGRRRAAGLALGRIAAVDLGAALLARFAAGGAAAGELTKTSAGKEFLLTGGENKILLAVGAAERPILKLHSEGKTRS